MRRMAADVVTMDKIVALCKRRGFVFPSSEIYGGLGSTYDYGHYGVLLKTNVKNEWWRAMVQERDDIVALDARSSSTRARGRRRGHLAGFTDPMVDCRTCGQRFRADHLAELPCGEALQAPRRGPECELTEARDFNLMFETTMGPVKDSGATVYLRPETAQGIFVNFKNVLQFARKKPPFGIAQIGKSFRNEITPGNFLFRTREFEQMEMEFFVPPDEAPRWYEYWKQERLDWYARLGIRPDHLRLREHDADELSHYSSGTADVEYLFPIGWSELEGIANRGDFDLTQHAEFSGEKLEYFDAADRRALRPARHRAGGRRRPRRRSPSSSTPTTRTRSPARQRTVLRSIRAWRRSRSPCCRSCARTASRRSRGRSTRRCAAQVQTEYDEGGSIGKRYRRQDEIGTPYCVTIDHQTLEDRTVTRARPRLARPGARRDRRAARRAGARLAAPWRSPKLAEA